MMKVAIYLRVSTADQTTDNQMPALKAYAEGQGYDIVAIYKENESAWKAGHQAELSRLLSDARHHKFEIVLVWALDRLSREGSAAILNLVNRLKPVKVISYQESWTEAPGELGELLFSIAGWVARMESQRRSERTRAGLARVMSSGVTKTGKPISKLGRPAGSKDKNGPRKRTGYLLRYANKGAVNFTPEISSVES